MIQIIQHLEIEFCFFDSDGNLIEEMAMNERLSKHITNVLYLF